MMGDDDDDDDNGPTRYQDRRPSTQRTPSKNYDATMDTEIEMRTIAKMKMSSCMTVCIVPPTIDDNNNNNNPLHVWDTLTRMRTALRDPGFFRWPPHANLLYPFVDIAQSSSPTIKADADDDNSDGEEKYDEIVLSKVRKSLEKAVEGCRPFQVHLDTFGKFGGKGRGILYLYPRSSRRQQAREDAAKISTGTAVNCAGDEEDEKIVGYTNLEEEIGVEPIVELQSALQRQFPQCKDHGQFTPHMTLSHFASLEEAQAAQAQFESEEWWNDDNDEASSSLSLSSMCFTVNEIYVLKREGDEGQFKILMTVPLGSGQDEVDDRGNVGMCGIMNTVAKSGTSGGGGSKAVQIHDPPIAFPSMPLVEKGWVLEERMKLKQRLSLIHI